MDGKRLLQWPNCLLAHGKLKAACRSQDEARDRQSQELKILQIGSNQQAKHPYVFLCGS